MACTYHNYIWYIIINYSLYIYTYNIISYRYIMGVRHMSRIIYLRHIDVPYYTILLVKYSRGTNDDFSGLPVIIIIIVVVCYFVLPWYYIILSSSLGSGPGQVGASRGHAAQSENKFSRVSLLHLNYPQLRRTV